MIVVFYDDKIKFLLIQRKDSLGFELIKGRYKLDNLIFKYDIY